MSWQQIKFNLDIHHCEELSAMLEVFGAAAITIENAGKDEYYEVSFPKTPDWKTVTLTALFDHAIELHSITEFIQKQYKSKHHLELPIETTVLVDQDWQKVWLESFKPVKVGHNLWVCPSWCEPENPTAKNIILDPGLAFGTGTHETTAMCLAWLSEQDLSGQSVLDYGSGSGILAIASVLQQATQATAIDIDPLAVTASIDNAQKNGFHSPRFTACLPNDLNTNKQYSLVIANILADVLIELAPKLNDHVASQGKILLTGILENQTKRVKQAYNQYSFQTIKKEHWHLLIGTKII